MVNEIVLVRHGETEWSRDGKHTGDTDVVLTANGRAQARRLGDLLDAESFSLVLASPRRRATETCRLSGLPGAELCEDLREWEYGAYEGRTTAEIREGVKGWTVWTHPVPEGETAAEVGRRADNVIERIDGEEGRVALFSHGHLLRVLGARWCGLDATFGRLLRLDTASMSVLGYEREARVIEMWNRRSP